jgi:hypothetical protein
VGVDAKSGASGVLDGYCLLPPALHEALATDQPVPPQSYPVIFYVYGEPAAQVARDHWMGKMGLWHRLLAQHGTLLSLSPSPSLSLSLSLSLCLSVSLSPHRTQERW